MKQTEIYPIYRKYKGLRIWFKILNDRHFIEIKEVGKQLVHHEVIADQYPEMLRIKDMIDCKDGLWETVDKDIVESFF